MSASVRDMLLRAADLVEQGRADSAENALTEAVREADAEGTGVWHNAYLAFLVRRPAAIAAALRAAAEAAQ